MLERLHRARPPLRLDVTPPPAVSDGDPPNRPKLPQNPPFSPQTLPPPSRQLLPDSRLQMLELELAPDPFFGLMGPGLPQVPPHGAAPPRCPTATPQPCPVFPVSPPDPQRAPGYSRPTALPLSLAPAPWPPFNPRC